MTKRKRPRRTNRRAGGRQPAVRDEVATGGGNGASASTRGLRSPARAAPKPSGQADDAAPAARAPATGGRSRRDVPPTSRFFSSLRATSPFPRLRVTLTHGLRAVFGSPALLLVPLVLTLPIWLALLAAGLDHVPIGMTDLLALPPIGSLFDVNFIGEIFGVSSASLGVLGIVLLARALMWSVLVGMTVESVETGRVTLVGVVRGLLAFPTILVVIIVNAGLAFFASPLSRFVGLLALYAVVIGGLYFLVFASVAAVRGRPRAADALKLSARAGRLPGSRHLGMVFLYFFIAFFLGFNPALQPGPAFTANPSFGEWVLVLVATLVHMVFLAGFAYRYIEVEGVIPEGPSPRQARLAGARARRR